MEVDDPKGAFMVKKSVTVGLVDTFSSNWAWLEEGQDGASSRYHMLDRNPFCLGFVQPVVHVAIEASSGP